MYHYYNGIATTIAVRAIAKTANTITVMAMISIVYTGVVISAVVSGYDCGQVRAFVGCP